ncbi:conserved hypothetical protein [Talaromyces stipitatus ATCC 10500]|uniref:SIMPL domain-containing protein n=1 Tax=Talaromyces stipitatus (strain ATCC 10500 / CBS 375.48 / QM 6759 / NRRL 1006) TaxID=441959 RepID=B8MRI3_TALSN|nr:uncharacterized protein TSTA_056190 [Talaromyces stipitatus ATCC 10500]EED13120.1 conserved hypothetical protein [Talaromyces stipitatus ATCC 10500]
MDLKIRVKGESSITRLADQGVLRLTVESEGSELETVSKEVISRTNELRGLFKTLSPKTDDGTDAADVAVTKIASTILRTRNHTPHDKDNKSLPKVYQASMSLSIVFRDITQLSQVVGQLVTYSNVEINSIDWSLSETSQKALHSQMRREAVRDALSKANDIAGEVGREVYPVEIIDEGQSAVTQHPPAKRSLFGATAGFGSASGGGLFGGGGPSNPPEFSETLDLSPPDIQVTSLMDVEFQSFPGK